MKKTWLPILGLIAGLFYFLFLGPTILEKMDYGLQPIGAIEPLIPIKNVNQEKALQYRQMALQKSIDTWAKELNKETLVELKSYTIKEKTKLGKYTYSDGKVQTKKTSLLPVANAQSTDSYEIEIMGINVIDGGIEVFARAWTTSDQIKERVVNIYETSTSTIEEPVFMNVVSTSIVGTTTESYVVPAGSPIGFGSDGTVEIERFKIYNPPVLVPDANGSVSRVEPAIYRDGELFIATTTTNYDENPETALYMTIGHNISITAKDGTSVIAGKVGNTTSTFYPDADPETTSVDGWTESDATARSWTDTRNLTTAASVNDSSTLGLGMGYRHQTNTPTFRYLDRQATLFDTSAIGSDSINAATLSFYGSGKLDQTGYGGTINVVSSDPASNTSIAVGDFDSFGTTEFSTEISYASYSTTGYNDFALNSSGLAAITGSGVSKFGTRGGYDISGTTPPNTVSPPDDIYMRYYTADQAGTTNDPKLVVVHGVSDIANSDLATSLVSHWEQEQSAGGTSVDSHGSNDLSDSGTVGSATGKQGNAADYTPPDYHTITDASQSGLDITGDMSISFWYNTDVAIASQRFLFMKDAGQPNRSYGFLFLESSGDKFCMYNSSDGTNANTTGSLCVSIDTLSTGTWYHFCGIYDASAGSFEVVQNGISKGTVTGLKTSMYNSGAAVVMGQYQPNPSAGLGTDGKIDEFSVWGGRTLLPVECAAVYAADSGIPYDAGGAPAEEPVYPEFLLISWLLPPLNRVKYTI